MNSQAYWAKREAEALKHYITDEKEYDRQIKRIYSNMLDACQTEINAFYGKYAAKEGITLAEAKKRVSQADIQALARKAKKYVDEKDFSDEANEQMRLYNATMKINRMEMLKANLGMELIAGHDELEKFMEGILQGRTEEEMKRQAGILGKTIKGNTHKAHAIVNASFHNATFSDRIWMYQDLMKADLEKLLTSGLIQGKNPRVLARELKKAFQASTFNAERLMRTELARVQTEAQKQSFERNGFDEYEFISNVGCCPICEGLNGKHFKVKDMMPGKNAPPMHPHCRCSTAAYSDRDDYEEWLDFLDKGGTTEEWEKQKGAKVNTSLTNKGLGSAKIKSRNFSSRNMAQGNRRSVFHILTDDEIATLQADARSLKIPDGILKFNVGDTTGFCDEDMSITVRGNVLPDLNSTNLRDNLSPKAVLAHEYYGHYKNHPSKFRIGDWRDEFRASYRAAIDAPGLSDEERRMLMLDAYDRAKEAGVNVKYNETARKIIYGQDE